MVTDPFYHKEKRKKSGSMLEADAWLDSTLYDFWQALGRGWTRYQDFMALFHVSGWRRFFVEIISDGLTFGAIGAVLMAALALPAFEATATGQFNKAEDISVLFLDRYGNEIGRRGIRSDDSVPLDKLPDYADQGDSRDRGSTLLRPLRRRRLRHGPRAPFEQPRRRRHAGRFVDHPAAGQEPLPQFRAHARAQDRGSLPLGLARVALHQGRDPQALSRPRLHGRRQFRRRGGIRVLLRQAGDRRQPRRSPRCSRASTRRRANGRRTSISPQRAAAPIRC